MSYFLHSRVDPSNYTCNSIQYFHSNKWLFLPFVFLLLCKKNVFSLALLALQQMASFHGRAPWSTDWGMQQQRNDCLVAVSAYVESGDVQLVAFMKSILQPVWQWNKGFYPTRLETVHRRFCKFVLGVCTKSGYQFSLLWWTRRSSLVETFPHLWLTLGVHAQRRLWYLVCLSVHVISLTTGYEAANEWYQRLLNNGNIDINAPSARPKNAKHFH